MLNSPRVAGSLRPWRARAGLLGTALCLLAVAAPVQAQWKWRDANGHVTASDRPPPREVPEKDILTRPVAPGGNSTSPRKPYAPAPDQAASAPVAAASAPPPGGGKQTPLQAEVEAKRRAAEQEAIAKAKAEEERQAGLRADNCKRAHTQVATLESDIRVARVNAKGEREMLDDTARSEELKVARAVVAGDCR
jgi:Domain of unknown function (DUF4124)